MATLLSWLSSEDGHVQVQGSSPLPYQKQLHGHCAWKEKYLPPKLTQMRPPSHVAQININTSFELTWWKDPNERSPAPGQIFYVWFSGQPQAILKALPGSPHRGKLSFPHQILWASRGLQSLKAVAAVDSGPLAGRSVAHAHS